MQSSAVKHFYADYDDQISAKRHHSDYWLRRYVHALIHEQFLAHVKPGDRVLDAGCGDGMLSCAAAAQGAIVIGVELSRENLRRASARARVAGLNVKFIRADAEKLPFMDDSFDLVMSCHVLEHLPNISAGASELYRVSKGRAVIAMPTCLNPACWTLLGGDCYWRFGKRSFAALFIGLARVIAAYIVRDEGPDEHYGGTTLTCHVWRFPRRMVDRITAAGFNIRRIEAGPLILLPYLATYLKPFQRFQKQLDKLRGSRFWRLCGFGTFVECRK